MKEGCGQRLVLRPYDGLNLCFKRGRREALDHAIARFDTLMKARRLGLHFKHGLTAA